MTPFVPHSPAFTGACTLASAGLRGFVRRSRGPWSVDARILLSPFTAPRPLPRSAQNLSCGLHSVLRLSPSPPSELLLLFLTSPSFPEGPSLFFSLSMSAILEDLHCGFHLLVLLYLPQRSEADVLGACLWPRGVGSERSGRVASENRTSQGGGAEAGVNGEALLAKGPQLLPKRRVFPEELSLCTNSGAGRPLDP